METALTRIPAEADWRLADLGTGSGAVALALATERRKCEVHGTDVSRAAIGVAAANARRLGVGNVHFHIGSWCKPLQGKFHLIVSNPPYIDGDDAHLERGDLRFEPRHALTPGTDGLRAIRAIAESVSPALLDGAWLMLEHGWNQGPAVREILDNAGFTNIETVRDLQGHERVTIAEHA